MDENQIFDYKTGGLTITEAIVKNIPMLIPFTFEGHEEENKIYR